MWLITEKGQWGQMSRGGLSRAEQKGKCESKAGTGVKHQRGQQRVRGAPPRAGQTQLEVGAEHDLCQVPWFRGQMGTGGLVLNA